MKSARIGYQKQTQKKKQRSKGTGGTGKTPVPHCLSPFSLSVVDYYADENENGKSRRVSLGPSLRLVGRAFQVAVLALGGSVASISRLRFRKRTRKIARSTSRVIIHETG